MSKKLVTLYLACASFSLFAQTPKFYSASQVSMSVQTIGIDACDLDPYAEKETKVEDALVKPSELFLITSAGARKLGFVKTERTKYKVCDSDIPRNTWIWKSPVNVSGYPLITNDHKVAINNLNVKFESAVLGAGEWGALTKLNVGKVTEKFLKACAISKWDKFIKADCEHSAYLFKDSKLLAHQSDPDNYVSMHLLATVKVGSETFYYIAFHDEPTHPLRSAHTFMLKAESGKEIFPEGCFLPSKC